jgi:hypothetical protein
MAAIASILHAGRAFMSTSMDVPFAGSRERAAFLADRLRRQFNSLNCYLVGLAGAAAYFLS